MRNLFLIVLIFFALSQIATAQWQSVFIAPQTTDPNISTNLNDHYVSITRGITPKNRLFVFFTGTSDIASNQKELNRTAADLGFHAINLTYPNDEAVNELCDSLNTNLDCYAHVRLEIKDGIDRTNLINEIVRIRLKTV